MDLIVQNLVSYIGASTSPPASAGNSGTRAPPQSLNLEHPDEVECRNGEGTYGVIVFSKGRPTQLAILLRSIEHFLVSPAPALVQVIFLDDGFSEAYESVKAKFPSVLFVPETNFQQNLRQCVEVYLAAARAASMLHNASASCSNCSSDSSSRGSYDSIYLSASVLFCVDDLVFFRRAEMKYVMYQLLGAAASRKHSVFGVHMKLHPGIAFSHPASAFCPPPKCEACFDNFGNLIPLLQFTYSEGKVDWNYPFDLCAGLYRCDDVLRTIEAAEQRGLLISNPNALEVIGNRLYEDLFKENHFRGSCLTYPCCSVVTINKVQSEFESVPVYNNSEQSDLHEMNRLIEKCESSDCLEVDYSLYMHSLQFPLAAHVGRLLLRAPPREDNIKCTLTSGQSPQVSVVLPVLNGIPYINEALRSIMQQRDVYFEVIVVDDGSSDDSVQCVVQVAGDFGIECSIDGAVASSISSPGAPSSSNQWCVGVSILRLGSRRGLVSALESGLRVAKAECIARMDADDVCLPNRLYLQHEFLLRHPDIIVVGGQALSIGEDYEVLSTRSLSHPPPTPELLHGVPTHPCVVAFELGSRCCVLHPTAMYRRSIVLDEFGGYRGAAELVCKALDDCADAVAASADDVAVAEDYALWAAISIRHPYSIANLPDVVLLLRYRAHSKSRVDTRTGRAAAAADTIRHYLARSLHSGLFLNGCTELSLSSSSVDPSSNELLKDPPKDKSLLKELQQIDSIYRRIKEDYQQRHVRYNNSDIDAEEWAVVSAVLRAARDKAMRKKCAVSFSGAQKQTTEIDGFLVQAEASFALCDVLKEHLLSSLGAY